MDIQTLDLLQKIGLIPAVIIAIVVVYRDMRASSTALTAANTARIADLNLQVIALNLRLDNCLSNKNDKQP